MKNEKIKQTVDELYKTISDCNQELDNIRKECPHEESITVNYSWRIGCCEKRKVCKFCGELTDLEERRKMFGPFPVSTEASGDVIVGGE